MHMLRAMKSYVHRIGPLAACLLFCSPATAQNIQKFEPAPATTDFITVEGAATVGHLNFVPSLFINYGKNPLVLRDNTPERKIVEKVVEHLLTLDLTGTMGLTEHLQLTVAAPLHLSDGDGATTSTGSRSTSAAAFGDLRFTPKVRFFGPQARDENGVGLAFALPVTVPTGDNQAFLGGDAVTVNPKAIAEVRLEVLNVAANVGYKYRPDNDVFGSLEIGNEVTYGASAAVALGDPDLWMMAELFGAGSVEDVRAGSENSPLEALLALRGYTGTGLIWITGLGRGLIADYGAPQLRVFVGLSYEDEASDRDGDGLDDDVDGCPDDSEDRDGFDDEDGCPDPDNDNDGIVDEVDRCPIEPETRNGFEDDDGCPDDIVEPEAGPVPDTDRDGLADDIDRCPKDPEDTDGFEDQDGCPDPDNDKDGIVDQADRCPNDAETVNGLDDEDGCPDAGLVKVRITAEKIEILDKVFFEPDRAVIKPISYDVLNQVATVLRHHPEFTHIRVEGHTDSKGKDAYNLKLSQKRSEAVRAFLIKQGVEEPRLEARGFGETQPITDNKTEVGRADNRRVEFRILEQIED